MAKNNPVSEKIDTAIEKVDTLVDQSEKMQSYMLSREKPDPVKVDVADKTVTVLHSCRNTLYALNGYTVEKKAEDTLNNGPTFS